MLVKILSIETSCDETAISIIDCRGGAKAPKFNVLTHLVSSQIKLHEKWGGVVPMLAKREHSKALVPMLVEALEKSGVKNLKTETDTKKQKSIYKKVEKLLEREPELLADFLKVLPNMAIPKIDAIAVTKGPGLEPALWVGINFAKALSLVWDKPLLPVNHMEGHIYSTLIGQNKKIGFPALALLVSGGHTQLVLIKKFRDYKVIGETRDDAVGEAFDKVARILGLPYPGGPQISLLADKKTDSISFPYQLPRPMLDKPGFDFSFSGLKTAVLYLAKELGELSEEQKIYIAWEFQNACIDVLLKKTTKAIGQFDVKTLIIGGGVVSNKELRERFAKTIKNDFPKTTLLLPDKDLSTDNATMIGLAAYLQSLSPAKKLNQKTLRAEGNLSL